MLEPSGARPGSSTRPPPPAPGPGPGSGAGSWSSVPQLLIQGSLFFCRPVEDSHHTCRFSQTLLHIWLPWRFIVPNVAPLCSLQSSALVDPLRVFIPIKSHHQSPAQISLFLGFSVCIFSFLVYFKIQTYHLKKKKRSNYILAGWSHLVDRT